MVSDQSVAEKTSGFLTDCSASNLISPKSDNIAPFCGLPEAIRVQITVPGNGSRADFSQQENFDSEEDVEDISWKMGRKTTQSRKNHLQNNNKKSLKLKKRLSFQKSAK